MEQLILHLIGDYLFQTDWLAQNKTKKFLPAFIHALVYSLPFMILKPSLFAWMIIFTTHFFIDRYRLVKHWVIIVNQVKNSGPFGYDINKPDYIAFWLLIIIDNTFHLAINFLALKYL